MKRATMAMLMFIAACGAPPRPLTGTPSQLTFPLEVLGPPGAEVIVPWTLNEDLLKAGGEARLELVLHNVVSGDSATLSVNGQPTIDLSAQDGPFVSSVGETRKGSILLPADALKIGQNSLTFQYTRQVQDGAAVSGYRVLSVSVSVGGKMAELQLPQADPSTWQPVRPDADSIERGRQFFQDVSRDSGPACARCHTKSGADLKYHAFSNHSIIERAKFHSFSQTEAEDIASYIRTLPLVAEGTVFDPPFQPGPGNHGAAGAGLHSVQSSDDAFGLGVFGANGLSKDVAWDWAAEVDTYLSSAPVAGPTWLRWLPRDFQQDWFTRRNGLLAATEDALEREPTLANAQAFESAALLIAKDVLAETGDHRAKIEILRFAAVKLWDWSRKNGFDSADHGIPDDSPAYPYEVGFAFFEASDASTGIPQAMHQTLSWWWAQLSMYPGRGRSTGTRPLNYEDVLLAAESASTGPNALTFLHLYGSWEESRGTLAAQYGTEDGPVRLLAVPMRHLSADGKTALMRRFLKQEANYLGSGGALSDAHRFKLQQAWDSGCSSLSAEQRASVRAASPADLLNELQSCP